MLLRGVWMDVWMGVWMDVWMGVWIDAKGDMDGCVGHCMRQSFSVA